MVIDGAAGWYRWRDGDLLLDCHLQPGASRSEFAGLHGGRLKIRIQAPPVDGRANAALIELLAREFDVAKQAITIEQGELGRQKRVCIRAPKQLPEALGIVHSA